MTGLPHRLPKAVEDDPRAALLLDRLAERMQPMRPASGVRVPFVPFGTLLIESLQSAHMARRVVRGLEETERVLKAEAHGMKLADRASGVERGVRMSRVLLLANDGGDSFYRQVERLLERHGARVLAIRVDADAATLGAPLFGAGRTTRLVMIAHKDAVASLLLALAASLANPEQ